MFEVGIDNYGLYPLELSPLQTLEWAGRNGAAGVQFSGLTPPHDRPLEKAELRDLADFAAGSGLYLEWGGGQHIPFDTVVWTEKDIFPVNRRAAEEARTLGCRIVRSCSGGQMRWRPESPATKFLLRQTARALLEQRSMLRDNNVLLAVETHFEFTTFELLRLFDMCEAEPGDWLGLCLDTMNLLVLLEDPVKAVDRVLPWVVSTHIKDGGLLFDGEGLTAFPVELGRGVVDISTILTKLARLKEIPRLSVEDHGGSFVMPIDDPVFLSEFPDLTTEELDGLKRTARAAETSGLPPPVERVRWPEVCESRLQADLETLKAMVSE
ncbi:MAG: sugar phosphate isomerase/epimerase [Acidobacteria bacterium]|nr:sugar phosphate isomerase/epimerase [Acidobacteriota bacterium]